MQTPCFHVAPSLSHTLRTPTMVVVSAELLTVHRNSE